MARTGLLAVNRLEMMRLGMRSGVLPKRSSPLLFSTDEIFRRYRGFDGQPWRDLDGLSFRTEDGLAAPADWAAADSYVRTLPHGEEYDIVLIDSAREGPGWSARDGWSFAGFDVGYFDSDWSHFSIILHEVLLGVHQALRLYASRLNQQLLMPNLEGGRSLLAEHDRLAALGMDVEEAARAAPVAIFVRDDAVAGGGA